MTAKNIFEYALVELNKREAPSLLLEDYNYFINKAINQRINKYYNTFEVNQQRSDDLRVLRSTAVLTPLLETSGNLLFENTHEVELPDDYLHVLNCIVEYTIQKNYKCYQTGNTWQQGASRLTSDLSSQIINNFYLKPAYKRPYYFINNITESGILPTTDNIVTLYSYKITTPTVTSQETGSFTVIKNDGTSHTYYHGTEGEGVSIMELYLAMETVGYTNLKVQNGAIYIEHISNIINVTGDITVEEISKDRVTDIRYGNSSKVRMEIRYGKDSNIFKLTKVYLDYLKTPKFIGLTEAQVDEIEDNSQVLEFPDYVCQEIVNDLVVLIMENASDPRIQTNIPINQSIADPGQQQK